MSNLKRPHSPDVGDVPYPKRLHLVSPPHESGLLLEDNINSQRVIARANSDNEIDTSGYTSRSIHNFSVPVTIQGLEQNNLNNVEANEALNRTAFPFALSSKGKSPIRPGITPIDWTLSLYDELILSIFSYLSSRDLCAVQATNRNWARLALDQQLWKALYLKEYGRTRLRGTRGFVVRADHREVKPLPRTTRAHHVPPHPSHVHTHQPHEHNTRTQSSTDNRTGTATQDEDVRDWKWMFRISSNWQTGRCALERLTSAPDGAHQTCMSTVGFPQGGDTSIDTTRDTDDVPNLGPSQETRPPHILLAGPLIITASSFASLAPYLEIVIPDQGGRIHTIECRGAIRQQRRRGGSGGGENDCATEPFRITALALDQSPPGGSSQCVRVAVFFSTSAFSIYTIDPASLFPDPVAGAEPMDGNGGRKLSGHRPSLTYVPGRGSEDVVHAVYHHPLLVTISHMNCSSLSFYSIELPHSTSPSSSDFTAPAPSSRTSVTLIRALTSFTSYPPFSLVLSAPSPTHHKLVLTYALPVYPSHWTVGATEIIISAPPAITTTTASARNFTSAPTTTTTADSGPLFIPILPLPVHTLGTAPTPSFQVRSARAPDFPPGWIDVHTYAPHAAAARAQWSRRVVGVAATRTDGRWVVLAPAVEGMHAPTGLQLYRLSFLGAGSGSGGYSAGAGAGVGTVRLTFVRTLYGATGPVAALALADGRCVSLGVNGSIWVWDLDARGEEEEEEAADEASIGDHKGVEGGAVGDGTDKGKGKEKARTRKSNKGWRGRRRNTGRAIGAGVGEGVEIAGARVRSDADVSRESEEGAWIAWNRVRGTVVFDERRIVSALDGRSPLTGGMEVRRFDV